VKLPFLLPIALLAGCALFEGEDAARRRYAELVEHPAAPAPVPEAAPPTPPSEEEVDIARKPVLGIKDCLRLAVLRSERLHAQGEHVFQADLDTILNATALGPKVAYHFAYFKQQEKVEAPGQPNESQTHWFTLQQPLFRGFRDFYAVAEASDKKDIAEAGLRAAKIDVALDCGRAFYNLLTVERSIGVLEHSLELQNTRFAEVKAREDNGLARRTERLLIETERARTEADLARARRDLVAAKAMLAFHTGLPDARVEAPEDTPRAPGPVDAYLDQTKNRPDVASFAHEVDLHKHEIREAQGEWLPDMSVLSDLWANRDGTFTGVVWDVTLQLDWPIFDTGKTLTKMRIAESRTREAEREYADARRRAATDVETAYQALLASLDQIPALETRVRAAEENVKLLDADYKAGIATNLEAVDAENVRRQAHLDLERERYNARLLELQLRAAAGDDTLAPAPYPPSERN